MRSAIYFLLLIFIASCGKTEQKSESQTQVQEIVEPSSIKPQAYTTIGNPSCGGWILSREEEKMEDAAWHTGWKVLVNNAWLTGYVSGINSSESQQIDFLKNVDGDSLYLFVDKYCQEHPLDDISQAADALYAELLRKSVRE